MSIPALGVHAVALAQAKYCLNLCHLDYLDQKPTGQCSQTGSEFNLHLEGSTLYVVYRGTQPRSLEDWAVNLLVGKIRGDDPHWGWFVSYKSIEWSLRQRIAEIRCERITHTGHSKGGAIAQVAQRAIGGACVTFGAPPPFAGNIPKAPGIAWENTADLVPRTTRTLGFNSGLKTAVLKYSPSTLNPIEGHTLNAYASALRMKLPCV